MAKDPAFLFYPGDWLGGTVGFSRAHKGAYMDLLMGQHTAGHMDIHMVKEILGEKDFSDMWELRLKKKFKTDKDGKYFNEKLENEMIKRKKYTDSRKDNLNHKDTHMDNHMENGNGNSNVFKDINVTFDDFWKLYDKKTSPKESCQKKWDALTDLERSAAVEYIPEYKIAQPDKQFRKDPATFLNQKAWNNELIYRNGSHIKTLDTNSRSGKQGTSAAQIAAARQY